MLPTELLVKVRGERNTVTPCPKLTVVGSATVRAQHNIVEEQILRGEVTEGLRDAVFELATKANDHILTARSLAASVPTRARKTFLVAVRSRHHAPTPPPPPASARQLSASTL